MDLLHAEFNNGRLSLEEIKACLGSDFGQSWPTLQKKFKQDETGLFFNEKLEQEQNKRKAFSESRRQNVLKKPSKPSYVDTSVKHMNKHMENENENNVFVNNKNEPPQIVSIEMCLIIAMNDPRWVNANKVTKSDLEQFNKVLEKRGVYDKNPYDYKTHYANWTAGGKKENWLEPVKVLSGQQSAREKNDESLLEEFFNATAKK